MVKEKAFYEACQIIYNKEDANTGIGTLREKTLHAVVKYYFEPDSQYHEIRYEGFVADIAYEKYIVEIQTRNFDKLRKKLSVFLEQGKVRVVYPIAYEKWLEWIDEETGMISKRRKSPKKGSRYQVFYELYKIKEFLPHPNFQFSILLLNMEEQRLLNGWSHDRKRGSTRYERIPTALVEQIDINSTEEFKKLLPESLEEPFSTKDYKEHAKIAIKDARTALHILCYIGIIEKCGKKGNLILYKRVNKQKERELL